MIYWIIATICAFFIKGLCGFANTLVFTSILSFGVNNINISPVELLLGYPSNLIIGWKERKAIDWKVCLPLTALVLIGDIPGMFLLKNVNAQSIKIVFGFVIIGIGIEMLFREMKQKKTKSHPLILLLLGLLSGALCGLFGIGALLAAYLGRVTDNTKAFRGNICMVFIIENAFRIAAYTIMGILTFDFLKQAVLLIPAMLLGVYLGIKSNEHLDDKVIKKIVIVMLILSGIALIVNNIVL
ncbi:MAG: sulfite exporter TauE/SafE family protein [Hespellia sp.]|nr:sulfite exporter TauE/SafE family protein [Hespellia sp.]